MSRSRCGCIGARTAERLLEGKTELILLELQILLLQACQQLAQILVLCSLRVRLLLKDGHFVLELEMHDVQLRHDDRGKVRQ